MKKKFPLKYVWILIGPLYFTYTRAMPRNIFYLHSYSIMGLYLSVRLPVCLTIYLYVYFILLSFYLFHMSFLFSVSLFVCSSVCLDVYSYISFVFLFIYTSFFFSIYLSNIFLLQIYLLAALVLYTIVLGFLVTNYMNYNWRSAYKNTFEGRDDG